MKTLFLVFLISSLAIANFFVELGSGRRKSGEVPHVPRGVDLGGLLPGRSICSVGPQENHCLVGTLVTLCLLLPRNVVSTAGQPLWSCLALLSHRF